MSVKPVLYKDIFLKVINNKTFMYLYNKEALSQRIKK